MQNKAERLAILALLLAGCPEPTSDAPSDQAPAPIGDELVRYEGTWATPACARAQLYRQGRSVQYQCFDADGLFSWENRGTLSAEAVLALDAGLAEANPDDTDPVNYMGLCGAADSGGAVTMNLGDEDFEFSPFCLIAGVVALYEEVAAIHADISTCDGPFERLESVEPGCRAG